MAKQHPVAQHLVQPPELVGSHSNLFGHQAGVEGVANQRQIGLHHSLCAAKCVLQSHIPCVFKYILQRTECLKVVLRLFRHIEGIFHADVRVNLGRVLENVLVKDDDWGLPVIGFENQPDAPHRGTLPRRVTEDLGAAGDPPEQGPQDRLHFIVVTDFQFRPDPPLRGDLAMRASLPPP